MSKALSKEGKELLMSEETTLFLLDVSGSMSQSMGSSFDASEAHNKIGALKRALMAALEERIKHPSNDRMGIVTFGGNDFDNETPGVYVKVSPETTTHSHLELCSKLYARGGTPMYAALKQAKELLESVEGFVRIVLVTDGCPTGSFGKEEVKAFVREMAKDYGFVIDTVGVGTELCFEYDEKFLKDLAALGEGQFYPVADADALRNRFLEMERERRALLGQGVRLLQAAYK